MQSFGFRSRFSNWFTHSGGLIAVLLFGMLGVHFVSSSSAATFNHDPVGVVDYCRLEGTVTTLYGWVHDPDAPAGAQPYLSVQVGGNAPVGVASNVAGYRDAAINNYLKSARPGAPTSSIYGWKLSIGGLYKGGSYVVSGTMLNYGAGSNVALPLDTDHSIDGNSYFNTNKTIPDACLAAKPVATAPVPAPNPSPTPAPVKSPTPVAPGPVVKQPTPVTSGPVVKKPTATVTTPTTSTSSSASDAVVKTGTTTATFVVPVDGATGLYILYGSSASSLNRSSDIQSVSGASTTVVLQKLDAKTTYTYQVVRTFGSQTANSPNANFTTKGYTVSLIFTSKSNTPTPGVKAELGSSKQTSDKNGKATFTDLPSGAYSPIFTYDGQSYSQDFATSSAPDETGTAGIVLSQTINVDKLATRQTTATPIVRKKSPALAILIFVVCLGMLAPFILWWVRRRKANHNPLLTSNYVPLPTNMPPQQVHATSPALQPTVAPSQLHTAVHPGPAHHKAPSPQVSAPEHMGESLRDMVIQSMADEAAQHPHRGPKPPVVPGG